MLKASGIGRWTIYDIVVKEDFLENFDSKGMSCDNSNSNHEINKILSTISGKKRVSKEQMEATILALCLIKPLSKFELSVLLGRSEINVRIYTKRLTESGHLELRYPSLNYDIQVF